MTILDDDEKYMVEALKEAVKAYSEGKFRGAVVVFDGVVVGRGHNLREQSHDPLPTQKWWLCVMLLHTWGGGTLAALRCT